ncbi:sterol esterase Tgl1p [Diutina catenulata]
MFVAAYHIACLVLDIAAYFVGELIRSLTGIGPTKGKYQVKDTPQDSTKTIHDIVAADGYRVRDHVVATKDGYLLVLHKLERRDGASAQPRGVVYFHHGLLTNSEIWVLGQSPAQTLAYRLVDQGYHVWLGNNRGNKYSRKHLRWSPSSREFWNFSLDEYAMYDIPASLEYVAAAHNHQFQVCYVGFSQGCSQFLASLSVCPRLNQVVGLFVGLSPAVIPQNLTHPIFKMIVERSSRSGSFLYSLFGRRAIMPSVAYWSTWWWYSRMVDVSLRYLFGWNLDNISMDQRAKVYPHLFSNTSVKSVHHWFQIIDSKRFQMYDEHISVGLSPLSNRPDSHQVAPFPIEHHLNVPMVLAFGDADILVDAVHTTKLIVDANPAMRDKLWQVIRCPGYEHMDTLWAKDVAMLYNNIEKYIERATSKSPPPLMSMSCDTLVDSA